MTSKGKILDDEGMEGGGFFEAPTILSAYLGEILPVVIDNGTAYIKAGSAGNALPGTSLRTAVASLDEKTEKQTGVLVGDDILHARGAGKTIKPVKVPIEGGVISDFDNIEKIWDQIFKEEIRSDPAEQPILLTEPPLNNKKNREQLAKIFFEKFRAPSIFIGQTGVLSLFANGLTSGTVLDVGHGITHVVPVVQGQPQETGILSLSLAGQHLTDYYKNTLKLTSFTTWSEMEVLHNLKEHVSYIATDPKTEKAKKEIYTLPDEKKITVENERFSIPEALFDTKLYKSGLESSGVQSLVLDSIKKSDKKYHKTLSDNVVLAGGSTLIKGFGARLGSELKKLDTSSTFKIVQSKDAQFSAWIGGSIFASLSSFSSSFVVTRRQYEESGASCLKFGF